jgi:uncharacterized membrane protein
MSAEHAAESAPTLGAMVEKLAQFRGTLAPDERTLLDQLLLAASGPEADVQGYGIGPMMGKQLAVAVVLALGLVGGTLSGALIGTAEAAPLEQPTLNGNMGGGTSGSSTRPSGGTQSTPSQPQAPSPNRGAGGNVAGLTGSPGITVMGAPLPPTHGPGPSAGGTIYGTNDPRAAALALQQAQQNIQNQIRNAQQQSREAGNQLWGPLAPQTRDLIYDTPPPARTPPSLAPETRDLIYDNPPPVLPPQIRGPDPRSTDQSNLADLTTQIENLQNQLNQLQQQTRQAPPPPPADWSNALPMTDPGAAEAAYRQRLAALDGQAAAWVALNPGADQTPIASLTQAQQTIQGHLDALIEHSRTTARNANVTSGDLPPQPDGQALDTAAAAAVTNQQNRVLRDINNATAPVRGVIPELVENHREH